MTVILMGSAAREGTAVAATQAAAQTEASALRAISKDRFTRTPHW
jgi:hypothetical protein